MEIEKDLKALSLTNTENIWVCDSCDEVINVSQDFYQESGTPVCPTCSEDMRYDDTIIMVDMDKIRSVMNKILDVAISPDVMGKFPSSNDALGYVRKIAHRVTLTVASMMFVMGLRPSTINNKTMFNSMSEYAISYAIKISCLSGYITRENTLMELGIED